jgi:hypothetical protein
MWHKLFPSRCDGVSLALEALGPTDGVAELNTAEHCASSVLTFGYARAFDARGRSLRVRPASRPQAGPFVRPRGRGALPRLPGWSRDARRFPRSAACRFLLAGFRSRGVRVDRRRGPFYVLACPSIRGRPDRGRGRLSLRCCCICPNEPRGLLSGRAPTDHARRSPRSPCVPGGKNLCTHREPVSPAPRKTLREPEGVKLNGPFYTLVKISISAADP